MPNYTNSQSLGNPQLLSEQSEHFEVRGQTRMRGCEGWQREENKALGQRSQDVGTPTFQSHMYWTCV